MFTTINVVDMSEKKRDEKHRITVYLNDDAYQGLQNYVTTNYSAMNSYGAISQTINNAVSYYTAKITTENSELPKQEKQRNV